MKISSLRRTNAFFITLAAGSFDTTRDGIRISENLIRSCRKWIDKWNYSIEMISYICDKKADLKKSECAFVDPHLHIILLANPGSTIAQKVVKYLEKKVNKLGAVYCRQIYDAENLMYYLHSYEYLRTIAIDPSGLVEFKACRTESRKGKCHLIIDDIKGLIYGYLIETTEVNKDKIFCDFWTFISANDLENADGIDLSWFDI